MLKEKEGRKKENGRKEEKRTTKAKNQKNPKWRQTMYLVKEFKVSSGLR